MSPENSPSSRPDISIATGTTMDNQILFELFSNTIKAAKTLNADPAFITKLTNARKRLPPMQIGKYGQLQEWLEDLDDTADKHRHVSHLFGLYPGNQISATRSRKLFAAAEKSLLYRGDVSTGWSMGWKVNLWARLLNGNHAYRLIQNQLTPAGKNIGGANNGGGTYPNLLDAHPPFQIDGNFGCTAGIAEMLIQSQDGCINLLPALPDAWKNGTIQGIKTRGGFEIIKMSWKDAKLSSLIIKSTLGGVLRIKTTQLLQSNESRNMKPATGMNPNPFFDVVRIPEPIIHSGPFETGKEVERLMYDLKTQPGQIYSIIP
jgi:alpha-L-fucosidase 2